MDERLQELTAKAFRVAMARDANLAIARARRERAGGDPDDDDAPALRSYELILGDWRTFVEDQLPKLVYHLESVGAHLPECRGVIVAAFLGEELHFVDASEIIAAVVRRLGVTSDQLSERYGTGERRTAIREPLLLDPPPKPRN